ncbi:MAG: T9SS type A sorting domain-containing protein, partial [Crocinitomicaceae bacterium]
LTVNPATSITTQPVGTAGCEGQNTTFTVVAAGTGSLSYQWKYGATNVGTNSASYNIPSTSTANDGNYSVVVTGGCGNATSNTVALNVYASPTTNATISTADITDATLCGKNSVSVVGNSPDIYSQGEWSVVGAFNIVVDDPGSTSATFTVQDNSLLGGATRKFVWAHVRTTSGNNCYTRDTITVDFKQPTITEISALVQNGDVLWNGLTNSSWSTSSNWYQYAVSNSVGRWIRMTSGEPTASTKVYTLSNGNAGVCVNSTNAPALGNGESASNVYVGDGATLNLSSGTLTIAGDLTNNGTISPSSGTITFNGTGAQKITGTGIVANFNNLIVNKASGTLTLEQPAKVAGTLTMTQGDIITDATNILEIGTNASSVGSVSWTAGTVRGPMKRWFAAATNGDQASGIFPVGGNISTINPWTGAAKGVLNRYAQVNFTSAPSNGGYIIAKYVVGNAGLTAGLPIWTPTQYIQNFEEEGYWDITPYDASGDDYAALNSTPYTLKLRLNTPSTNDGSYITEPNRIRIISSKGPSHNTWVLAGTQGAGQSQTSTGDYLLEETGVTGFSWFNGGGDNFNPLPVELTSFTGVCDNGIINLTWQTASEFNSSHFDVEKSRDGENWQVLTTLPSAGTSNELITYQTTDQNATDGNNYFRLRQVDIDGTEKLYNPINVSCSEVTTGYFSSFPNPSGSAFQVIVNNKDLVGACTMNIVDASGKVIEQREIEVKDGINMYVINQELTPGMYFLNISNGSKSTPVLRHAIK